MIETNKKLLKHRKNALKIIWQAIESANPESAINKNFRLEYENLRIGNSTIRLSGFKNILVIGAGKASTQMAKAIENILIRRLTGGLICTKYGHATALHYLRVMEAGHPIPDKNSLLAAQRTLKIVEKAGAEDLIICLISGGASAIWSIPYPPVTFEEKQRTTEILVKCGADIHEINTVRKHLSGIKGGRLAQAAHPATIATLAISDVVGDELTTIGSGPTVSDPTTFEQAFEIISKYDIAPDLPPSVQDHIWNGFKGLIKETPGANDSVFSKNPAAIIASNKEALAVAMQTGRYLGYKTYIYSSKLTGEAREVGPKLVDKLKELARARRAATEPIMLLSGGETTVTVKGKGKGGRNQELILSAALALAGLSDVVMASVGTDGSDGTTDAAGAFADCTSIGRGQEAGLDAQAFLDNNDSYEYFNRLGDLIRIGPTGTNVMDIQVFIIG